MAGHTDVVPPGNEQHGSLPPFAGEVHNGALYGRGAVDMKGAIAAFIEAALAYRDANDGRIPGSISLLITGDEEGPAVNGTRKMLRWAAENGQNFSHCIVGEPTSLHRAGDTIKVGRRGSLTGAIRLLGKQGHIAYPHLALNPVPAAARLITMLDELVWDEGNEDFPPTSFQISNVHAGTGAGNVIPGQVEILCNFRFSPESQPEDLKRAVEARCHALGLKYGIEWTLFGMPFDTPPGPLRDATVHAIAEITGLETVCSTSGGTSDGRFIAPTGAQVIELGPVNETIHRVDECVSVDDLVILSKIHERILEIILA